MPEDTTMVKPSFIADRRFVYSHDPKGFLDVHTVTPTRSSSKGVLMSCLVVASSTGTVCLIALKESSLVILFWSFVAAGFLAILKYRNSVEKEAVVIMPAFGVQLETDYLSGRTVCRFVPIDKILKPVLVERVTPVTCYWSLSLVLREEAELMLVFKLRPPVKILTPIWKALCAATDPGNSIDVVENGWHRGENSQVNQ